ncbi:MAG TPA: DUF916 and DUF3324 domain-containing protein [Companilactobacillus farciminis]|uniref:DUF916 and DUF3324 domain-containing protein n=1 Tax=Companilactobacillus farciminis TaxID=1612 RepID=A0A921HUX2_9LACO|nr:DUF916 and DUF3324 domain-containing protein [Companilactobacillus farciminis]
MKKSLMGFLIFISMFLGFQFLNTPVQAAVTPTVNYSVSPETAANQIDKKVGYFDLKVSPNQKENIKFKINNNSTSTQSYNVQINRATTDVNGVIVYNKHGVKPDSDLKYNIENLVTYPKKVTVPARSSKEVTVGIQAPSGHFEGELLGGILVEENNQINNKKRIKGVSLRNKYDYVLGLQLQQSTAAVKSDLKFDKAFQVTTNSDQISVEGQMDNDVPELEKKVSVDAKVTPKNSKKIILKSDKQNMSIAPDSDFDYPVNVNTPSGVGKNKRLKPGTYTMYLNVKANNGENNWKMKRNFTISSRENKQLNKKVPNRSHDLWIILGAIVAMMLIAGSVIYIYRKRR